MPSRGAKRGTPRTAVPTSRTGDARPGPPRLSASERETYVPVTNERVVPGSLVLVDEDAARRWFSLMHRTPSATLGTDIPEEVSVDAPVGRALIGTCPGAELTVSAPRGSRRLRVL